VSSRFKFLALFVVVFVSFTSAATVLYNTRQPSFEAYGSAEYEEVEEVEPSPYIDPSSVDLNNLFTFTCELSVKKPEELIRSCADAGMLVYGIKWDTWSPFGATGTGIYSQNLCEPNCAEGSRAEVPVKVSLDKLIQWKGKFYLVNLEVTPVNPDTVPPQLSLQGWDVSEFAIRMD
jgi:hypothetical protein